MITHILYCISRAVVLYHVVPYLPWSVYYYVRNAITNAVAKVKKVAIVAALTSLISTSEWHSAVIIISESLFCSPLTRTPVFSFAVFRKIVKLKNATELKIRTKFLENVHTIVAICIVFLFINMVMIMAGFFIIKVGQVLYVCVCVGVV